MAGRIVGSSSCLLRAVCVAAVSPVRCRSPQSRHTSDAQARSPLTEHPVPWSQPHPWQPCEHSCWLSASRSAYNVSTNKHTEAHDTHTDTQEDAQDGRATCDPTVCGWVVCVCVTVVLGQAPAALPSTSFCYNALPYNSVVQAGACLGPQEAALANAPNIMSVLDSNPALAPCKTALVKFMVNTHDTAIRSSRNASPEDGICVCFRDLTLSQTSASHALSLPLSFSLSLLSPLQCVSAFPSWSALYFSAGAAYSPCRSMCSDVTTYCADPSLLGVLEGLMPKLHNCTANYNTVNGTDCYAPPPYVPVVPNSPRCVSYAAQGGSVCSSVFNLSSSTGDSVYLPGGPTPFAAYEGQAAQLLGLSAYIPNSVSGRSCKQSLLRQVCTNVFLACDAGLFGRTGYPNVPVPFPKFGCQGDCLNYKASCLSSGALSSSVLSKLPAAALSFLQPDCVNAAGNKLPPTLNCTGGVVTPGQLDFPLDATTYPALVAGGPPLVSKCNSNFLPDSSLPWSNTTCAPLRSTSYCSSVLPPEYTASVDVFGTCQDNQEGALSNLPQLISVLRNPIMQINPACADAVAQWACVAAFPACNLGSMLPCNSMCAAITASCNASALAVMGGLGFSATCVPAAYSAPGISCYAPPASTPTSSFVPTLPSPPRCADYTAEGGVICASVLAGSKVYIPAATSFAFLEGTATTLGFLFNFVPTTDQGAVCYRALERQVCTNLFQGCSDTLAPMALPIPFPKFACRDECQEFAAACDLPPINARLRSLPSSVSGFLFPNCTGSGLKLPASSTCGVVNAGSVAKDDFPSSSTSFSVGAQVVNVNCTAIGAARTLAINVHTHCPFPLRAPLRGEDAIPGTNCAVPCPIPLYTEDEYLGTDQMFTVFAVISWVLNGFLMVTWILFDSKRKQTFIVMFCVSVFALTCSLMIGVWNTNGHPSNTNCVTKTQFAKQDDTHLYCAWQGAFVHGFSLMASFWWAIIAFDLFILLVIGARLNKQQTKYKIWGYFAFGCGLPLFLCCLTAGVEGYGPNSSLSWCFVLTNPVWIEWTVFWVPVLFVVSSGAICILAISYKLYRSSQLTGQGKKAGNWKQYIRPLLFCMEFFVVFSFILSYKINAKVHETEYTNGVTDWVTCLLSPNGSEATCGRHPHSRPTVSNWRGIHFGLAGQGLINFAVYGTQWNNYQLWLNFCFAGLGFSQKGSQVKSDGSTLGEGEEVSRRTRQGQGHDMDRQASEKKLSAGVEMRRTSSKLPLSPANSSMSSTSSPSTKPAAAPAGGVGRVPASKPSNAELQPNPARAGAAAAMGTPGAGPAAAPPGLRRPLSSQRGSSYPSSPSATAAEHSSGAATSPDEVPLDLDLGPGMIAEEGEGDVPPPPPPAAVAAQAPAQASSAAAASSEPTPEELVRRVRRASTLKRQGTLTNNATARQSPETPARLLHDPAAPPSDS